MSNRKRQMADDSSDEEAESESPIDEDHRQPYSKSPLLGGPPTSLSLRERRLRRDSVSRCDTSGSSAGDLGDITPCNASPHLPGLIFRTPIRDEREEIWRKQLQALLANQPSSHAPDLLNQSYRLIKELTIKSISLSKDSLKYFTGIGSQLGNRISILAELLTTKEDPPKIWYNQSKPTTPRLFEALRFNVLEVQEHLETFFDRREHVSECLESVKTSCKLALFTDNDNTNEGSSSAGFLAFDPATAEILVDLGRALYKLMFQLLLLIESNHKITATIIHNLKQDEKMEDLSGAYVSVRGALLRSIDDDKMESLDTSTSTEGDHTPTPSPGIPMSSSEFETVLNELIDNQKWSNAITHVRQFKRMSQLSSSNINLALLSGSIPFTGSFENHIADELSIILNVHCQKLIKDKTDAFITSKTENEMLEVYTILTENLYHVSSALTAMEINMKSYSGVSSTAIKDVSDIVTTL